MKRSKPNRMQGFNADDSVDETVFDAPGRKIKVTHPGGSERSEAVSTQSRSEASIKQVMAYDLASRLISECECKKKKDEDEMFDKITDPSLPIPRSVK